MKDGRFEANDVAFERNTFSTANGLDFMDGGGDSSRGCRGSKRLLCINLEREEFVCEERLVLDLCVNGHCDLDGFVGQTVCESHWTRILYNYVQWKMRSSIMRRYLDPDFAWNFGACDAELWNCGYEICKNRLDGSAVNLVCVKTRSSSERRQSVGEIKMEVGRRSLRILSQDFAPTQWQLCVRRGVCTHSVLYAHVSDMFLCGVQTSRTRMAQECFAIRMSHGSSAVLFPHGHFDTSFPSALSLPNCSRSESARMSGEEFGYLWVVCDRSCRARVSATLQVFTPE